MENKQTKQPLAIGQSDFREFRKTGAYYVDKSLLIRELLECSFQVVLLPRPRRFGKTLNLSMLRYFFEKSGESCETLFAGLAIRQSRSFTEHQGKYPVIFLTFKDAKKNTWSSCYAHIKLELVNLYGKHRYLLDSDVLFENERNMQDSQGLFLLLLPRNMIMVTIQPLEQNLDYLAHI